MLSILIPTYNYDVSQLVVTLHKQAKTLAITYEIIVFDDASKKLQIIKQNQQINDLENCSYTLLSENIGRSKIRNLLAKTAQYNWLLFLDADVAIESENFINEYLKSITDKTNVIYGGIRYQKEKPEKEKILRWIYGNFREALSVKMRCQNPHISFLTLNFVIKKEVFSIVKFNENIPNLRHEDTLFALDLKKHHINISHIDNPIIHLGLESSQIFLKKSEEAVDAILLFEKEKLIQVSQVKITRIANKTSSMSFMIIPFYKLFKPLMKKNLLGKKPSLFIFDIYRLGYLLNMKKEKNA